MGERKVIQGVIVAAGATLMDGKLNLVEITSGARDERLSVGTRICASMS
jgi:hypothetical protein